MLVDAVRAALHRLAWELLFVDDSDDGTDAVVREMAAADDRIRLVHRDGPAGGLSGAVLEGFALAVGDYCCVIDGDLQHPPELIPALVEKAKQGGCDVVIASRYIPGAAASGLAGPARQLGSRGLKWLARLAFPRRLAGLSDPLSGYFLVRSSVLRSGRLRPIGYKILLEILVRCRWKRACDVPYTFGPRAGGESKANTRQVLEFLRHLARLSWDCSPAFAAVHRNIGEE